MLQFLWLKMFISKRLFTFLSLYLALTILAHAQQQRGFVSIDCGGPENFEYTDGYIKYNTDGAYINTGVNKSISSEYNYPKNPNLPQPLSDLRSFPEGKRNCYSIKTSIINSLHLVRASFLYGNYDGENKLPEFDLYVDVNFWSSVTFRNASEQLIMEIISLKVSEEINVCLVNKGLGIPFISALEIRPIIYGPIYNTTTEFGSSASLILFKRWDIAALNGSGRYEDDVYDRIWSPYGSSSWETLETSSAINGNDSYKAPFEVTRTAARPKNESDPLEFSWKPNDPNSKFYVYLYFAEVEKLQKNQLRKFNISWNGSPLSGPFVPSYLHANTVSNPKSLVGNEHQISISRTEDSTLPPILNAVEIYVVRQLDATPTFEQDVDAIMNIKGKYGVQRNWVGDPCEPKDFIWDGLECNYSNSLPPRIISLNLSSRSLSGEIASEISNLLLLESLDLSNNSLTGSIPQFLEDLKSLKVLNLKGNHLSGSVPDNLLERSRTGLLTLSVDDQNICGSSTCKKKKNIAIPIAVSISSVLVLLIVFALIWKLRKKLSSDKEIEKANKGGRTIASKKWQYNYEEVLEITNNFEMVIGKGGFGIVYRGEVKDGNQVAVKMLSPSSSQGPREFQTEAELLMTVHHRNLVSFTGYCDDNNKMALIYEYMPNGNLKNYLSDKNSNTNSLTWQKRLEIAIDAAQGLEYLHHGCKPPIIHRDVKTANILLNENLEAKIADFGLSKVFKNDNTNSNAESEVMGTTGYLDPEYYKSRKLNEKSDIYSFGVVILELITGKQAVIKGEELVHITAWVTYEVERGDFSRIVDQRLEGKFSAVSVEKALGIAMACCASPSIHRPSLNIVVQELKQCLEMELPPHSDRFEMVPRQLVYSDMYSSSEPYSYDTDSITNPVAR